MKNNVLKLFVLAVVMLTVVSCGKKAVVAEYNIIPEPVEMQVRDGNYEIKSRLQMHIGSLNQNDATVKYIQQALNKLNFHPVVVSDNEDAMLMLNVDKKYDDVTGEEGYLIDIDSDGVHISASTETGVFYGFQTFVQMLPDDVSKSTYRSVTLPFCHITDYPRYEWRGSHMDVCRHFFSVEQIKRHLDVMAAYKMNRFHWHLTEDQGWRLEISKYPLLTEVGAWRIDRNDLDWCDTTPFDHNAKATYGGYYSKSEVKEIVEYAAERHIEIVPEIEFPGHCCAALAAYPELGCPGHKYIVAPGDYWPPEAIMCAGNDTLLTFLRDVMDEVIEMFPFEYIHVGGDEANKVNWTSCPKCQARIKALKLKNEEELQGWLTAEIEKYLIEKGKRIIGWDEILEGFVTPSCTVMSWRGNAGGIVAARKGNDVIMSPTTHCYFDYRQGDSLYQPQAIGRARTVLPLVKVYQFNPTPTELTPEEQQHILGGQCNLWAEYIKDDAHQQYLLLPRMCAMAECLWSPLARKSWPNFQTKIEHHKDRLVAMGYNVCWGSFKPMLTIDTLGTNYHVTMEAEELGTQFHYTTDGSVPTISSPVYEKPLDIKQGTILKTLATYRDKTREGVYTFNF